MKIFHDGDKFWNYAKEKYIDVHLKECPECKAEAILIDDFGTDDVIIGSGYVTCTKPECLCRTRFFFTDTNYYSAFGIEMAQEKWNNREYDWFENDDLVSDLGKSN